ncbi:hypothetical protein GBA52_025865 [Prunus armeniaca]|nr:hypothetical protein GBA52_025865 [Prunus armeniaca]
MELLINSLPKCTYFSYNRDEKLASHADDDLRKETSEHFDFVEAESLLIKSVLRDNKAQLVTHTKRLADASTEPLDRSTVSKLLHLCCNFDSPDCASALLGGELGTTPLVNEFDDSGKSALHTAALAHAAKCVEVLLKKHARTGLRTRDGRAQLALDLSLSSARMDVIWTPDEYTLEDLVVVLGEKDLTTVRLLSEKTKEIGQVAYANAVEGRIVALAALLVVAAEKISETVLELRDNDSASKEKVTLYECVVREALSLVRPTTPLTAAKRTSTATENDNSEKRRLLLLEIELLQLFGAVAESGCTDKKVTSPLIRAAQVGDEAVMQLLLKTNIDVNDADAEGNSALHWTLKLSRSLCPQQIKILWLLIKHGARVSQRNKLGLTALHIAAGNGNSEALQVLLLEAPDGTQYKTEIKETPLFFAVRNDSMECAELLLSWGASSEILNLRRQRPIDLTTSQDMRFILLNPTSVNLSNNAFPNQHKYIACSQGDEAFSSTREALLTMTDEYTTSERKIHSSTKVEICKYFVSPRGCVRGAKCFYAHGMEEHQKVKQEAVCNHSHDAKELKRIFVGGLPPSVGSDSLGKFFEEQFGPVDDAIVIFSQIENKIQSRGFGFVTFKEEKSVSAAVQAHYVSMLGKPVEIKSVVTRLAAESEKLSPRQQGQEKNCRPQLPPQMSSNEMIMEANKPEQGSWLGKLLHGQPKTSPIKPRARKISSPEDKSMPIWLKVFKKWFPGFLQDLSKHPRTGKYALSSLKGDFRAKFGLELDHAPLGFSKLSDFIKSFSNLCTVKVDPVGKNGFLNHMILQPKFRHHHQLCQCHTLRMSCNSSVSTASDDGGNSKCLQDISTDDGGDSKCLQDISTDDGGDSKCLQDISTDDVGDSECLQDISTDDVGDSECLQDISTDDVGDSECLQDLSVDDGGDSKCLQDLPIDDGAGNLGLKETSIYREEKPSHGHHPEVNSAKDASHCIHPRVLQFLKPDPLFHGKKELDVSSERGQCIGELKGSTNNQRDPQRHLVLETLARKRNKSFSYFLRDFDFYKDYKECILEGKCFGCNQKRMLWANFPCQHLLWCSSCKVQAILAAGDFEHKCVVCDLQVHKIITLPCHDDFPPIVDPAAYLPTPLMKKTSPLSGNR